MAFYSVSCIVRTVGEAEDDSSFDSAVDDQGSSSDDCRSSTVKCSFVLPHPLRLKSLRAAFPYEGRYHFRVLVKGEVLRVADGQAWVDLVDEDKVVPFFRPGDSIFAQALQLSDENNEEDEDTSTSSLSYNAYIDEMDAILGANRPDRFPVDGGGGGSSSYDSQNSILGKLKTGVKILAKESASTMWNTFKATASHLQQTLKGAPSLLSDVAEENLAKLSEDLASVYTENNPEHSALIREMWSGLFPGEQYLRINSKWKEAGFQGDNPVNDLKTSGVLALRAMVYFTKTYPIKSQAMIQDNKANTKSKYPFAIVGVNVTLLLAEVLNLRDQRYLSAQAGYWEMFEDPKAFFEIFCIVFFHIDNTWKVRNAVRTDFSKIMGDAKTMMTQILTRAPKSLADFRIIATDVEMHVHNE